nr:hypothetical protein [Tanacetum cinerariifolium]
MTMINKCLTGKAITYDRPRLPMLQILWGMVTVALRNIRVPRKKRLETVFEESAQSEGVKADTMDFKETKEKDEIPLVRRQTGVVIGDGNGVTIEFPNELNQKGPNEGSSVTLAVFNEPSGSSSSSSSDLELKIEDISSDDENNVAEDKEKAEAKKAEEEKSEDEQHMDNVRGNEQVRDAQAKVYEPEPCIKKPEAIILSSNQTLSSVEYGNQFIDDNPKVSLADVLKEPEVKVQSLADVPVFQQKPAEPRPPLVDSTVILILEKQHFH